MVFVVIQIPCFNEEAVLPVTLAALPRHLPGVSRVEWLVIDDGSSDRTRAVAESMGVDHIVALGSNRGLAKAFMAGLEYGLQLGADIIVNTDADNQYNASDIPRLLEPIMSGRADIVIGSRQIREIDHFSPIKKLLQRLGSWTVRRASGTNVQDAPSGFRAINRGAAIQLSVFSQYTYTLETIIQAGLRGMRVFSVPIRVNDETRPSRLVKNIGDYVLRSAVTILRIFVVYKPLRFFTLLALLMAVPGILLGLRFLYLLAIGGGQGNVQSLILASLLISLGFVTFVAGILGDLLSVNRRLLEDLRVRVRMLQSDVDAMKTPSDQKFAQAPRIAEDRQIEMSSRA